MTGKVLYSIAPWTSLARQSESNIVLIIGTNKCRGSNKTGTLKFGLMMSGLAGLVVAFSVIRVVID
jgi:hypothetical protein|tara:strand:+ start:2035 stop:2232 length:198 start_codon:yes stop_codon:yes gene_type:complete